MSPRSRPSSTRTGAAPARHAKNLEQKPTNFVMTAAEVSGDDGESDDVEDEEFQLCLGSLFNRMRRSTGPVASSCAPPCPDCPDLSRPVQTCPDFMHRCNYKSLFSDPTQQTSADALAHGQARSIAAPVPLSPVTIAKILSLTVGVARRTSRRSATCAGQVCGLKPRSATSSE